ncbi:MAG: HAMP domain-containing sensor histidine kinase [bacterium]|nr:HAMP domain-containing sensor histidine kinase [bacterium]
MSTPEKDFESNLSHIRHELRSPLNAIIGYTEMLIGDAKKQGQEDFLSDLRRIHSASMRLLGLIKELLDPARMGTPGTGAQQDSEFDLKELVEDAAGMFQAIYSTRNLAYEVDLASDEHWVKGSESELVELMVEFCSHMAELTRSENMVFKLSKEVEDRYRMEVTSEGAGENGGPDMESLRQKVGQMGGQLSLDRDEQGTLCLWSVISLSAMPGSSQVQDSPVATPEHDREVQVPDSNFSDLVLPESLYARLREAVEMHSITETKKSLAEVRDLGPEEQRLAEYLGALNQRFDMEGVLKVLEDIGHA